MQITRLTDGTANDQLLYFTSSSLTADDRTLVFISDRDSPIPKETDPRANVNLYALDRDSGTLRRLTSNQDGYLRSYVYFEGRPYQGLGLASPSLHAPSGDLYYLQGRELRCVNAFSGAQRTLAELPGDHVTGFTHVSDDNTRICVPTIHESAFSDIKAIDATVQRLGLAGHIRVYDTRSGEQVRDIEVDRGWVTHVQFQPGNNDTILFNHEWPADCGIRRVWLWDGSQIRRVRDEGPNDDGTPRRRADWVCHEVWSRDGRYVIYHGGYADDGQPQAGLYFVARYDTVSGERIELTFPPHFRRYGHFTVGPTDARLVSDGYAEYEGSEQHVTQFGDPSLVRSARGGEWISLLDVNWSGREIHWRAVCRHGSSWSSQDAHPHPIYNHAGDEVLFTSDHTGQRAVYGARI